MSAHPSEWEFCGYNEIQKAKQRYSLIDQKRLHLVVGSSTGEEFKVSHASWIEEALRTNFRQRENHWTESIAVGSKSFVEKLKEKLGYRARGRRVEGLESGSELKEHVSRYKANIDTENEALSLNNGYFWSESQSFPIG